MKTGLGVGEVGVNILVGAVWATLLVNCGPGLGAAANLGWSGMNLSSLIELAFDWTLKTELRESLRVDLVLTGSAFIICSLDWGSRILGLLFSTLSKLSIL